MDSAIETGWRTIRIWIPFATSRGSKRCCESFDAPMPAMQESHLHLEIAHVLFADCEPQFSTLSYCDHGNASRSTLPPVRMMPARFPTRSILFSTIAA